MSGKGGRSATELHKPAELVPLGLIDAEAGSLPLKPSSVPLSARRFIMWDGEAVKDGGYCLLGASTGDEICLFPELGTLDCLKHILRVGAENPASFHFAFSFDYDVNNILVDLPWTHLMRLRHHGEIKWCGYKIKHIPGKQFYVEKAGIKVRIDDMFSYFRQRFDKALVKYGVGTDAERDEVTSGKDDRDKFMWADIERIKDYFRLELKLGVLMADKVRFAINAAGFNIGSWHGPGALASNALSQHKMKTHKQQWDRKAVEYNRAVQIAYAGGWFEKFKFGVYRGKVYTADINSAYVYAMSLLPSLATGHWEYYRNPNWRNHSHYRMGVYHVRFGLSDPNHQRRMAYAQIRGFPGPLFIRSRSGGMSHPVAGDGWYWAPEVALIADQLGTYAEITEAWVFEDDGSYPFEWVADMYQERLALQADNDPAEKALKWAMASMYGRVAQRVGWNQKTGTPPAWHQLEWAGWITSMCRAMVFRAAVDSARNGGLVSIDTDGVISTTPFTDAGLATGIGNQLGRWKVEEFTELVYMQTGFYWMRKMNGEWAQPKTRGIPARKINDPRIAMDALAGDACIEFEKQQFIGYGAAMQGRRKEWLQWVDTKVRVNALSRTGARVHEPRFCTACQSGKGYDEALHNVVPRRYTLADSISTPHKLPWYPEVEGTTEREAEHIRNLKEMILEV